MNGRAKGRLAVAALVVLLAASAGLLATSVRVRVRYWTWRMRSADATTAAAARAKLFEIWRPAIDDVLPELIARELATRMQDRPLSYEVVDRRRCGEHFIAYLDEETARPIGIVYPADAVAKGLAARLDRRAIILRWSGAITSAEPPSPIAIPLDDDMEPAVLDALRDAGLPRHE